MKTINTITIDDGTALEYHIISFQVPGSGRLCTGVMSSSETLRRILSLEGQNTIPSLVFSISEFRHQYEESVGVYKISTT